MIGDVLAGLAAIAGALLLFTGATGSYNNVLQQLGVTLPGTDTVVGTANNSPQATNVGNAGSAVPLSQPGPGIWRGV